VSSRNPALPAIGLFYLILGGVAAAMIRFLEIPLVFLPRGESARAAIGIGVGVAFALLVVTLSTLGSRRYAWVRALENEFRRVLGPMSDSEAFLAAVLSGCAEELLFRGALQPLIGYPLASIAFGLVHVGPGKRFLPWTAFAIAAGFAFGGLVHLGFGLLPAMLSHGLINFLNLRRIGMESDLFADD
jgi:membrane protease YdiL (CAAX protease family)